MKAGERIAGWIDDALGWWDLAHAAGLDPQTRQMYRKYAWSCRRRARDLARAYHGQATIRHGYVVVPFPARESDRVLHFTPAEFAKMYIDVAK